MPSQWPDCSGNLEQGSQHPVQQLMSQYQSQAVNKLNVLFIVKGAFCLCFIYSDKEFNYSLILVCIRKELTADDVLRI